MTVFSSARPAVILLVDDDKGDQELMLRSLRKAKIYNQLHIVEDGEQALDYLFRRGKYRDPSSAPFPDLVLLDLNLPRIDGREVLRQIRENPKLKRLVVVVITTSKQEEDIVRTYDLGVNSYVTKPVDFKQFTEVISHIEHYWLQVVVLPPKPEG